MDSETGNPVTTPAFRQVLMLLYRRKTFVYLALATGLHVFRIYGLVNWSSSFLSRLHGMKTADIGVVLGLIFGFGGVIGTFAGGFLTDRFGRLDKQWYLKIPAIAIILSILFVAGALFLKSTNASIACLGMSVLLHSMYLGPSIAVVHSLVPATMRALASAILFLVLNLLGLGLGPLVIGIISDSLAPRLGQESLRWAMSIILIISAVSASLFFVAAGKLNNDLESRT